MGIQPIDLQTMYSQLSNVSKSMQGAQQVQLTEAMQQQNNIQKNMENATKVQQTSGEKTDTNNVNQNGSNSSAFSGKQKRKNEDKETPEDNKPANLAANAYKNPYIGTIIDITR